MTIKKRIEPLITELQKIVDEINSTSEKYKLEVKQQKKKKKTLASLVFTGSGWGLDCKKRDIQFHCRGAQLKNGCTVF